MRHRASRRPEPEPLELHDTRVVAGGTLLWLAGLVVLTIADLFGAPVHGWWLQMCAAGIALGVVGLRVLARRDARRAARAARADAEPPVVSRTS